MQSLAVLVAILVFTCAFSGPIALLLSSKKLQQLTEAIVLKTIRRTIMAIVNFFGVVICAFFISAPTPLVIKLIALASLIINIFAIDHEYGGKIAIYLKKYLRRDSNGPVGQS